MAEQRPTHPALPEFAGWPTFPFEGDLRVRKIEPPVADEPPRQGERGENCPKCAAPDSDYVWVDERWRVRSLGQPSGLPAVVVLETRHHYDLGDLSNMLAAELGVLTVRLERAMRSLEGVARVHVNRWGDGAEHLHVFFLARPKGMLQLRGTFLSMWDDVLSPIPEERWRENLAFIAAWLAEYGGKAVATPPPIHWDDLGAQEAGAETGEQGARGSQEPGEGTAVQRGGPGTANGIADGIANGTADREASASAAQEETVRATGKQDTAPAPRRRRTTTGRATGRASVTGVGGGTGTG